MCALSRSPKLDKLTIWFLIWRAFLCPNYLTPWSNTRSSLYFLSINRVVEKKINKRKKTLDFFVSLRIFTVFFTSVFSVIRYLRRRHGCWIRGAGSLVFSSPRRFAFFIYQSLCPFFLPPPRTSRVSFWYDILDAVSPRLAVFPRRIFTFVFIYTVHRRYLLYEAFYVCFTEEKAEEEGEKGFCFFDRGLQLTEIKLYVHTLSFCRCLFRFRLSIDEFETDKEVWDLF